MQQLQQMISIYHTGYIICLVLFIIFLITTIALFFLFDIRRIFDMKTGRGAKRSIQKMEEINAQTGKLRQNMVGQTPAVLSAEERVTYPVTMKTAVDPPQLDVNGTMPTGQLDDGSMETTLLDSVKEGSMETTLLQSAHASGSAQTDALHTEMLDNSQPPQHVEEEEIELPGLFKIVKDTMWIHTEEVI